MEVNCDAGSDKCSSGARLLSGSFRRGRRRSDAPVALGFPISPRASLRRQPQESPPIFTTTPQSHALSHAPQRSRSHRESAISRLHSLGLQKRAVAWHSAECHSNIESTLR